GDNMFFLKRQIFRVLLGTGLLVICAVSDYHRLIRWANYFLLGSVLLLVATLADHRLTGDSVVARWLSMGPISIQPSDIARLSMIIFLAAYLDRKGNLMGDFRRGFLPPVFIIGVIMTLIVLEPDFSTAALLGILGLTMLFIGGTPLRYVLGLGLAALPVLSIVMLAEPYRRVRIQTFLGLLDSPKAEYQISQSLISLGNGGLFGRGLGNSVEKRLFLPAPHTDFVFAIIGEELGLIGTLALLAAFLWLFQRAMIAARNAPDSFGLLLAVGIGLNIMTYVLVNTGVVTEVLPNTGVPLPLISYGGTHMVFTLMSIGILLNISAAAGRRRWGQQLVHARTRT
ncbi:MAG: putative peptidoglycan glycosyltransferase FtsW, partial [Candidatus Neomarinimicrobiota bacterium]